MNSTGVNATPLIKSFDFISLRLDFVGLVSQNNNLYTYSEQNKQTKGDQVLNFNFILYFSRIIMDFFATSASKSFTVADQLRHTFT